MEMVRAMGRASLRGGLKSWVSFYKLVLQWGRHIKLQLLVSERKELKKMGFK